MFVKETKGNTTDSAQIGFTVVLQPRTVWAVTWTVHFAGVIERESIQNDLEIFTRRKRLRKDLSKSLRIYAHIRKRMRERGLLSAQKSVEFCADNEKCKVQKKLE